MPTCSWPEMSSTATGLLRRIDAGTLTCSVPDFAKTRLAAIAEKLGMDSADLVVTIAWNTDNTDVDLHVIDPKGEECFYKHATTKIGGRITQDVTQGYGPEMFVLRDAIPGTYRVKVKYYASDVRRVSARTRVLVTIYENWGRSDERRTKKTVVLANNNDFPEVARLKR